MTPTVPVRRIRYSIPRYASHNKFLPRVEETQLRFVHDPENIAIFGSEIPMVDIWRFTILSFPRNEYQTPTSSSSTNSQIGPFSSGVASVVLIRLLNGKLVIFTAAAHKSLDGIWAHARRWPVMWMKSRSIRNDQAKGKELRSETPHA